MDIQILKRLAVNSMVLIREINESLSMTDEQRKAILSDHRVDLGTKLAKSYKLYRGISEYSGGNMAVYGSGLYTTADFSYAKKYGKVTEMDKETSLPRYAIRFKSNNDYQIWLGNTVLKVLGMKSIRNFNEKYKEISEFFIELDPEIDGVQLYTGKDSIFVKF